jgi:cyclohexyl-isocyanide hydratase
MKTIRVGLPIFERVDLIDVAGPWDMLSRVNQFWSGNTLETVLLAKTCEPVVSGQKLLLTPMATFADYANKQLDVLLVPGAQDVSAATGDADFLAFIKQQAKKATWVTAVCTGAVILSAAGLLDGYQATTHWAALDDLKANKNVKVVNGYPRFVRDRNRFTTGGVASSLDGTLELIALITGDEAIAKATQLIVQYHPQPPFDCGDPAVADYATYALVTGG